MENKNGTEHKTEIPTPKIIKPTHFTISGVTNTHFAVVEIEKDKMREKNRAKFADMKWLKVVTVMGKK